MSTNTYPNTNTNMNPSKNDSTAEVYTGSTLISLRREPARSGSVITAYVNGISLRCSSAPLRAEALRDTFVESILVAAGCDPEEPTSHPVFKQVHDFLSAAIL